MTERAVPYIDEVQSRAGEQRDPSVQKCDDDHSSRRRSQVVWADGRSGQRGYDRPAKARPFFYFEITQKLGAFVSAFELRRRSETLFARRALQRSWFENSGRARTHDFLYPAALRCHQKIDGSLHIVSKNLMCIARPEPIVPRYVKDVSAILHRCINRIPTEEIALHPVDRTIAPPFCRSRQCPNISARLNQQRRHVTADETGCACYEDVLADEKM